MDPLGYYVPPPDYSDSDSSHSDQLSQDSLCEDESTTITTTTKVPLPNQVAAHIRKEPPHSLAENTDDEEDQDEEPYYQQLRPALISPPVGFGLKKSPSLTSGKGGNSGDIGHRQIPVPACRMNFLKQKTQALFFEPSSCKNQLTANSTRPASSNGSSCKVVNLTKKSGTSCIQIPYNDVPTDQRVASYLHQEQQQHYHQQMQQQQQQQPPSSLVQGREGTEAIYSSVIKKSTKASHSRQIAVPELAVPSMKELQLTQADQSTATMRTVCSSTTADDVENVKEVSEVLLSHARTNWQRPVSKTINYQQQQQHQQQQHQLWPSTGHRFDFDSSYSLVNDELQSLPPIIEPMTNCISIRINQNSDSSQLHSLHEVPISSVTTVTTAKSTNGTNGKPPKRSMSMKSLAFGSNAVSLEPMINEFRFYQKTQKSILGQKSELQRAIEKRQAKERLRLAEEEKLNQKTGLERLLELRAKKLVGEMNQQEEQQQQQQQQQQQRNEKHHQQRNNNNKLKPLKLDQLKHATSTSSLANSPVSPSDSSSASSSSVTVLPSNGNSRALAAVFESAASGKGFINNNNNHNNDPVSNSAKLHPHPFSRKKTVDQLNQQSHVSAFESILKNFTVDSNVKSKCTTTKSEMNGKLSSDKGLKIIEKPPSIIDDESLRPAVGKVRSILNSIECNNRNSVNSNNNINSSSNNSNKNGGNGISFIPKSQFGQRNGQQQQTATSIPVVLGATGSTCNGFRPHQSKVLQGK